MPEGPTLTVAIHYICGVISHAGPHLEPLACGYPPGHADAHSWASLPSYTQGLGVEPPDALTGILANQVQAQDGRCLCCNEAPALYCGLDCARRGR